MISALPHGMFPFRSNRDSAINGNWRFALALQLALADSELSAPLTPIDTPTRNISR